MIRCDRCNWLAHVSDYVLSKDRLVLLDEAVGEYTGHIVCSQYATNSVNCVCGARVDVDDAGMRMR